MKKHIRLYNVMFPIWFLFLLPNWGHLLILPLNFGIDSLVLYLGARHQKLENKGSLWKKSILKIWLFGFLSDILGALLIVGLYFWLCEIPQWNLILFPGTTLLSIPGVALSGVLIYIFNRKFSFRNTDLTPEQIHKLSLLLAIATAPYTMMIPLYG